MCAPSKVQGPDSWLPMKASAGGKGGGLETFRISSAVTADLLLQNSEGLQDLAGNRV